MTQCAEEDHAELEQVNYDVSSAGFLVDEELSRVLDHRQCVDERVLFVITEVVSEQVEQMQSGRNADRGDQNCDERAVKAIM